MPQYAVYIPLIHAGKANNICKNTARQKQAGPPFCYSVAFTLHTLALGNQPANRIYQFAHRT